MTTGTAPTGNRYWLKQHQVTAFWHGFGISNGLDVPEEMTKRIYINKNGRYTDHETPGGRVEIRIRPEFMQKVLLDYIKWLKNYGEGWDSDHEHPHGIVSRDAYMKSESDHESRQPIIEMIELLQKYRINDVD